MTSDIYGKQTIRPRCGVVFVVYPDGIGRGGIYTNAHDLKNYIRAKRRQGFKLVSVEKMQVSNKEPHYSIVIKKGDQ